MHHHWKLTAQLIAIFTLSYCLICCKDNPIKTNNGGFYFDHISNEEFKQRQQDPSLMIQEIERERRSETLNDMKKQDGKEQADRNKKLNDLLDKQLRGQSENK